MGDYHLAAAAPHRCRSLRGGLSSEHTVYRAHEGGPASDDPRPAARVVGRTAGWDVGLYDVMEIYLAITALVYIVVLRRRLLATDAPGDHGA